MSERSARDVVRERIAALEAEIATRDEAIRSLDEALGTRAIDEGRIERVLSLRGRLGRAQSECAIARLRRDDERPPISAWWFRVLVSIVVASAAWTFAYALVHR